MDESTIYVYNNYFTQLSINVKKYWGVQWNLNHFIVLLFRIEIFIIYNNKFYKV